MDTNPTMHRRDLLDKLDNYKPIDAADAAQHDRISSFVKTHPDCFKRSLAVGHITGSAWLINKAGTRVLLTHHRKLDMWLQLGGHTDGDADVLRVAIREAQEESGLNAIHALSTDIFDLDVHEIPAREDTPVHDHHDIRFLLQADTDDDFIISDESHELRWCTPEETLRLSSDKSVQRMVRKWQALL